MPLMRDPSRRGCSTYHKYWSTATEMRHAGPCSAVKKTDQRPAGTASGSKSGSTYLLNCTSGTNCHRYEQQSRHITAPYLWTREEETYEMQCSNTSHSVGFSHTAPQLLDFQSGRAVALLCRLDGDIPLDDVQSRHMD